MAEVRIAGLSRDFAGVAVLQGIDLVVADGAFVSLLGPSGCGKSTTLSLIAGLDQPTGGTVQIGERVVADPARHVFVAPERRGLGLVPQSYALWPHMTVHGNVAFPLEIRGGTRAQRDRRVQECLDLVEVGALAGRYPHELSGGQQQRVALARALAYEPKVLLLDEPFSNVDAKLRERARSWLRQLQRRVALTTIFVTHDQAEALTMSDRVAVMSAGRIVQYGTPVEIYTHPATAFVADFIGSSNLLEGRVLSTGPDGADVDIGAARPIRVGSGPAIVAGASVVVSIRTETINVCSAPAPGANWLPFAAHQSDYIGGRWMHHGQIGAQPVRVETADAVLGAGCGISFLPQQCLVFPGSAPRT